MQRSSKFSRYGTLCLLICLLAMPSALPCRAQSFFVPDPLEKFDGKTWGGLTIGETKTDDIKRTVKTSRGAIRPEAMLLPQPEPSHMRIDVLMHGRGGTSVLEGFRIAYLDAAPNLGEITDKLQLEPEIWFPRVHYDEWQLAAFPEKGIVAFIEGAGRAARVDVVLLCSPSRVVDAISDCVARSTPIADIKAAFPDDRRVLQLGKIHVDISSVKGLTIKNQTDVERDLEKRIARVRTPREVDIVDGTTGVLNVDVTITFKDKKAKVETKAALTGHTPLGHISVTADGSDSIREDSDSPVWRDSRYLENAVFDAVDRAYRRAAEKVQNQRPPTPEELRNTDWNARINRAAA